jgi:HemY protein
LALRANDLAKARIYFEKSIALGGPMEAYRELGALLERVGEKDKAITTYRRGLEAYSPERSGARRNTEAMQRYRLVR